MQIILTKEEYDKLKPISEYTSIALAYELADKCREITRDGIPAVVMVDLRYRYGEDVLYKVSVEKVEAGKGELKK